MTKSNDKSNLSIAEELIKRKEAILAAIAELEANPDRPDAPAIRHRLKLAQSKVDELEDEFMQGNLKRGPGRPKKIDSHETILAKASRTVSSGRQGYINDLTFANEKLRIKLETARMDLANLEIITKLQMDRNDILIAKTQANLDREVKEEDL